MVDPQNPTRKYAISNSPIASQLPVTLKEGDEFTIPLKSTQEFHKFDIAWRLDSRCTYEVLLNLGGGQFSLVQTLETNGGAQKPRLDADYKANDLRIRVVKGSGTITNFDCLAL